MQQNSPLPFELPAVAGKKVSAAFDGGTLSPDAVVLPDQAGWHLAKEDLVVPNTFTLEPLPPKSPERNGMANAWQFVRGPQATPAGRYLCNSRPQWCDAPHASGPQRARALGARQHHLGRRLRGEERLHLRPPQLPPRDPIALARWVPGSTTRSSASTPCSVKAYFDVSIATRFSSIGRLLGWLFDSPTLASKAAGPSTPTSRIAAMGTPHWLFSSQQSISALVGGSR
jgi:hypothetical protein